MDHQKFHFIGIGGIGMSALAAILLDRQCEVSGSDLANTYVTEMLKEKGAKVFIGHDKKNVPIGAHIIYATGISNDNPELLLAKEKNYPLFHRADLINHLAKGDKLLAVAGTHGKTTTSSLLAHVLYFANLDPSFAIGGILPQYQQNGRGGRGEHFVIEACESDGTFLKYQPHGAIVTNVDADHLDFYGSQENLQTSFFQFFQNVLSPDFLFWCGDDADLKKISNERGISYGFNDCDLKIGNFQQEGWQISFDIKFQQVTYPQIAVPLVGVHNALNAAAVFGLALACGVNEEVIRQAFKTFNGVRRRCEKLGDYQNILFLDDYAHHPSEIKATLTGIKEAVRPNQRLIALYQPHRYSRSQACFGQFSNVFEKADEIIITNIYSAGELPIARLEDRMVADDIAISNTKPTRFIERQALFDFCINSLQAHDVLVTLGAGDITHLGKQLSKHYEGLANEKL